MFSIRKFLCATVFVLLPTLSYAWEIFEEREDDGRVFWVAEQIGEAGTFLRLVCFEQETHVEVMFPFASEPVDDITELFQVDAQPERLVAGFVEEIDENTSIFVGVDRRDLPAASTPTLINEMIAGRDLYLGDPDRTEAIERWSMSGATKAIRQIRANCS